MDAFTFITGIVVALVPVALMWLNLRAKALEASAKAATAAIAADATGAKVTNMEEKLDGRLTKLIEAYERESVAAFERGRMVGRESALAGPVAADLREVKEHLSEQDRIAAERHGAAAVPVKPVTGD